MKTTMQFLSLLLCFELVIGPMRSSLILSSNAIAGDCSAGMEWSNDVNRCVVSKQTIETNNKVDSCGAGNKDCYENNAKSELNQEVSAGNVKDKDSFFKDDGNGGIKQKGMVKVMNAATLAIPLLIVTNVLLNKQKLSKSQRANYKCRPNSLLLMYGAAAALGVGEIYGHYDHKKRLDKVQKEWDDKVVPTDGSADKKKADATEAQGEAFEFLAKNEDNIAQTAKTKKGFYLAATGLFAAGAIAAALEQYQLTQAQADIKVKGPALKLQGSSTNNPALITQGDQMIETGRQTVQKLTCATGDDGKMSEEDYNEEKNSLQKQKEKLLKQNPQDPDAIKAIDNQMADLDAIKAGKQNAAQTEQTPAGEENSFLNNKNKSGDKFKTSPSIYKDFSSCTRAGYHWTNFDISKGTGFCSSASIKKDNAMERVAIHNLSTAQDAHQMLELMRELDSIQFENYTKVSYLEDHYQSLKEVKLPQGVASYLASSLMPEAQAQDGGGKLLAVAGMALPLLGGLKSIIGGVKFQGGQPIASGEVDKIKGQVSNKISTAIGKPTTRLAINGVLGAWMGIMSAHMAKQQKISQERAAKLRSIKSDFASVNGILNCTDDDRNDASKPKCFCFTAEKKFNTARSNNEVCNQAFKGLESTIKPLPAVAKVCVNQGMAMDANCKCRATNSCFKTTKSFSMKGFSPSAFKMISTGAGPADGLFSGVTSAGDITDSATINAARIQKAASDMVAKMDPKGAKANNSYAAGLENSLIASAGGLSMANGSRSSGMPSSPSAAAKELENDLKANKDDIDITTAGTKDAGGEGFDSVAEPTPEFNTAEDANNQEIEIAEVMSQEVDFGSNDIKSSDANIFEVLSNRYQRSGMRRLFEDQVKTDADKPADTDITE